MRFHNKMTSIVSRIAAICLGLIAFCSCDSIIYDDEGDCDPHYKVKFRYDMNMKFSDAFPAEVNAVTLYIIDESGNVVWHKSESGEAVKADGYLMDVDIAPGTYTLLAWCGEGAGTHFEIPSDATDHTALKARLQRERHTDGEGKSSILLNRLYHGTLKAQVFPNEQGVHIFTVNLIKDTNEVNIVLQHLSGEPVNKDDFTFTITDYNGYLDHDNNILPDEKITYFAHYKAMGTAGIHVPEVEQNSRYVSSMSACIAELSISRLVKGQDCRVTVYNKAGNIVLSIPLIDYALLVKGSVGRPLDDQEFLDRQDKYDLVFFLDEGDRWMNSYIYINSWKVVLQNSEL